MHIHPSPEVAAALAAGHPVVALETTLICHGIPKPRNIALALAIETAVREEGAVPATVGVLDGVVKVGLSGSELERLALAEHVVKCGARDIAVVLARRELGATTVGGTIRIAAGQGIRVMATGGIGGVHRGGETSLDVSADLPELARSGVAVVCSGAKIILDLPRTLEVLETLGVPVVGMGTDLFPAFYVRSSGLGVARVDGIEELVALLDVQAGMGWPSGVVIANPPPAELAFSKTEAEAMLGQALSEARAEGIIGQAETPFLLARLAALSEGRSVTLNEALVLENARLAAALAARWAATHNGDARGHRRSSRLPQS